MATMAPSVQCPELATPPGIVITLENVRSLNLSTYERDPGTTVQVSCLSAPEFRLVGASTFTCLSNGSWNFPKPSCEPNIDNTATTGGNVADNTMVPPIIISTLLGVIFLALIGVMVFVICFRRKDGCCCRRWSKDHEAVRPLSVQEAESVFTQRRLAVYPPTNSCKRLVVYPPSEVSENLDSVSMRLPPHMHAYSLDNMANERRAHSPRDHTSTSSIASYDGEPMPSRRQYFGNTVCNGRQPSLKTRVGTNQTYRTWQDLFPTT